MKDYVELLSEKRLSLQEEEMILRTGGRKDESNLVKIRINILDVCRTVWQVVARTEKEEDRAGVYLQKMHAIRVPWQEAREKAAKYQAEDQVMIEDIKLHTLDEALQWFEEQCV